MSVRGQILIMYVIAVSRTGRTTRCIYRNYIVKNRFTINKGNRYE